MHLDACTLRCADDLALRIEMEGPDSVAAVFMEPVQNTGGAFTPPDGYWKRSARSATSTTCCWSATRSSRVRALRAHVRQPALWLPARHDHLRQGRHLRLRAARWRADQRPPRRTVPQRHHDVPAGPDLRRSSGVVRGGQRQPRHLRAGRHLRPRARQRGPFKQLIEGLLDIPSSATCAATATSSPSSSCPTRPPAACSPPTGRVAAARVPLAAPVRGRAHLPRRRSRRAGDHAVAAAHRRPAEFEFIESTLRTALTAASHEFAARVGR
jgi:hypothetical protein